MDIQTMMPSMAHAPLAGRVAIDHWHGAAEGCGWTAQ